MPDATIKATRWAGEGLNMNEVDGDDLRAEVIRLLAAALGTDAHHLAETDRRDQLHVSELDRRDVLHVAETARRQDAFDVELDTIRRALSTRDIIGQAKGIIMASKRRSADEAFELITKQSQAENRKVHDICADIAASVGRRRS